MSARKSNTYLYIVSKAWGVLCAIFCVLLQLNHFPQWYIVGLVAVVLFSLPEIVSGQKENSVSPPQDWYK